MDEKTTVQELKDKVEKMRTARNWHTGGRSAAISICLEAAELLEHFQWEDQKQNKNELAAETADVLIYLCDFANEAGIDLADALEKKLKKIDEKYPVAEILKQGGKFYYSQKKKYRQKS